MTLQPNEITRLVNLLGMSGSAHDGEALNAVRLANALLAKHHLSWPAVIAAPLETTTAPEATPDAAVPSHHVEAEHVLATAPGGALTTFERNFLVGIFSFESLSEKQAATLRGIKLKVEREKAMAAA